MSALGEAREEADLQRLSGADELRIEIDGADIDVDGFLELALIAQAGGEIVGGDRELRSQRERLSAEGLRLRVAALRDQRHRKIVVRFRRLRQLERPAQPGLRLPGLIAMQEQHAHQSMPGCFLPLFIFEERYRLMLKHALNTDRMFCVGIRSRS